MVPVLQIAAYVELGLCWVVWSMAFVKPSTQAASQKEAASAPASRWGIFLVMVGFALACSYVRPVGFQKSTASLIVSMILGPPSVALGWAAARHLGKQWRYKAALSQDHELIQTGPYRWLRHPIYASMLGMLVATLAACTWWPMAIGSVITFPAGTEIRLRAENACSPSASRIRTALTARRARRSITGEAAACEESFHRAWRFGK
jgi:protein-S-isoprenylcysteine O-methyltransferase Ste14